MSNNQALTLDFCVQPLHRPAEKLRGVEALTPRDILTRNVRKLIGDESVRAWAMSRGLNVRLIERITEGDHNTTLEKIDEIASACGVPAWQLLLPDFEPGTKLEPPLTKSDRELLERLKGLLQHS